jgi:non-ribosomal peptide synthetase component E (peptide arylation enzyme)
MPILKAPINRKSSPRFTAFATITMFEEQVAKTPDRIALSACDGKLTYKELDRLANITANSLIEKGLEKGGYGFIFGMLVKPNFYVNVHHRCKSDNDSDYRGLSW